MPVNVAPPPASGVTPNFLYNSDSDHPAEGYPIDQSTLIEGGPGAPSGSDRHALVINKNVCKLYEIFNLQNFTTGQTPSAGSGAVWDLSSNAMRPDTFTSADAAGLPITPLLLRPHEIQAGTIAHAIRFTAHCTSTYIWPASHQAGSCSTAFPPMGARFRLKSSYSISSFSATTQVVLRAFQRYGLILADNGADWFFGGTTDDWWGTAAGSQVVSELKTIPAAQFDAIEESGLQAAANSYKATSTITPRCTAVSASAAPSSPSLSGTPITITGSASGCTNPLYEFWYLGQGSSTWQLVKPYSAANTFNWNSTGSLAGNHVFSVWVRDAANAGTSCSSFGCYDAYGNTTYVITTQTCGGLTTAATPPAPQSAGTMVTITATATGCSNQLYQFWYLGQGSSTWQMVQGYSTTNTYNWNSTGAQAGNHLFSVWIRAAGSPGVNSGLGSTYDTYGNTTFTITVSTCTSVTASAAPPPPQPSSTAITVTASAAGCTNPRYEFWILGPGGSWTIKQGYSSTPSFSWNTTGLPPGAYRYSVWVRDASSGASYDTYFPGTSYTLT